MPDLTPSDFDFLSYMAVLPSRTCSVKSLHAHFTEDVAEHEIDRLYSMKLIDTAAYAPYDGFTINHPISYYVTMDGVAVLTDHLLAADRQRKQDADQDEKTRADALQREKDKQQSFRNNLLIAVISSLVTLAVEHCMEVIDLLNKLIHWLLSFFH